MMRWCVIGLALLACDDAADPPIDQAIVDAGIKDARTVDEGDMQRLDQAVMPDARLDMRLDQSVLPDQAFDMAPDQALDMAPDQALDMAPDQALDMAPDQALDMALDQAVDAAPDMPIIDQGPPREMACFDTLDNDGDGRIDCADPDCRPLIACFDAPEDCGNGVDDNGDNWVDCDDVLCLSACPPQPGPALDVAGIQARFDAVCVGCHAPPQPAAQLDLTAFVETTVDVRSTQVEGFRIVSGDHRASYLWRKMAYEFRNFEGGGGEGMPPIDALDAHFVRRFGDWIDALAP